MTRDRRSRTTGFDVRCRSRVAAEIGPRALARRLVAAADAERRAFERKLHDGVQQELVALVVNLQLARELCATDPDAAGVLLDEVGRDTRAALDGAAPARIGDLPAAARCGWARRRATVAGGGRGHRGPRRGGSGSRMGPELVATVYFCCLEALRNAARHAGAVPRRRSRSPRARGGRLRDRRRWRRVRQRWADGRAACAESATGSPRSAVGWRSSRSLGTAPASGEASPGDVTSRFRTGRRSRPSPACEQRSPRPARA